MAISGHTGVGMDIFRHRNRRYGRTDRDVHQLVSVGGIASHFFPASLTFGMGPIWERYTPVRAVLKCCRQSLSHWVVWYEYFL